MMKGQQICSDKLYALRIEGKSWMDDLTIDQAWAVLRSAYQQLAANQELLFMLLLPSGEMPAKCLPRSVFEASFANPRSLESAIQPLIPPHHGSLALVHKIELGKERS
jgi:hypothetical protein